MGCERSLLVIAHPAPAGQDMNNQFEGDMLSILRELVKFLMVRKKYWLLPIFLLMALLGGLLVVAKGSAVAPFIYTLF